MSGRSLSREFAIVAGLALALPVWAKPLVPPNKAIELDSPARVGNTALLAGQHELIVDEKTATFEKGNTVVVEIPYQLIGIAKPPRDAIALDKDKRIEIDFAGKSMTTEFADTSAPVSPSPSSRVNH